MGKGFTAILADEPGRGIFLVNGMNNGKELWHYVRVPPEKVMVFKSAVRKGSLDVSKFGEVLFSGWGKEPPKEIQQKIKNFRRNKD